MSHKKQILKYLQSGRPITPLEALQLFGCLRLSARIYDLVREGHPIRSEIIHDQKTGKKYAQYRLEAK